MWQSMLILDTTKSAWNKRGRIRQVALDKWRHPNHVTHCVLSLLYYTVLYYTTLYCTILYSTILYCTVLYCASWEVWRNGNTQILPGGPLGSYSRNGLCIPIYIHTCIILCIYMYIYIYTYIHTYVCIYIYIYIYIHTYIYIYIYNTHTIYNCVYLSLSLSLSLSFSLSLALFLQNCVIFQNAFLVFVQIRQKIVCLQWPH